MRYIRAIVKAVRCMLRHREEWVENQATGRVYCSVCDEAWVWRGR